MISQQGRVLEVDGNRVSVLIGGVSGCEACDAGKGCGAGIFGRLLRNRQTTIQLPNSIGAVQGQTVHLGITEKCFVNLVLRLYAWPLLAGLAGAVAGYVLAVRSNQDGMALDFWTLLSGLATAALALLWSRNRFREFPGESAVHLLGKDDATENIDCVTLHQINRDIS